MFCDYKPLYEEVKSKKASFGEGDEYIFVARAGWNDSVIAYAPDGRTALFDRVSPLTHELLEGDRVRGVIIKIGDKWVIVQPLEVVGRVPPLDSGMPELVRRCSRIQGHANHRSVQTDLSDERAE